MGGGRKFNILPQVQLEYGTALNVEIVTIFTRVKINILLELFMEIMPITDKILSTVTLMHLEMMEEVVSIGLFWFCFVPFSFNGICFLRVNF